MMTKEWMSESLGNGQRQLVMGSEDRREMSWMRWLSRCASLSWEKNENGWYVIGMMILCANVARSVWLPGEGGVF